MEEPHLHMAYESDKPLDSDNLEKHELAGLCPGLRQFPIRHAVTFMHLT